jgi:hypothetical protein
LVASGYRAAQTYAPDYSSPLHAPQRWRDITRPSGSKTYQLVPLDGSDNDTVQAIAHRYLPSDPPEVEIPEIEVTGSPPYPRKGATPVAATIPYSYATPTLPLKLPDLGYREAQGAHAVVAERLDRSEYGQLLAIQTAATEKGDEKDRRRQIRVASEITDDQRSFLDHTGPRPLLVACRRDADTREQSERWAEAASSLRHAIRVNTTRAKGNGGLFTPNDQRVELPPAEPKGLAGYRLDFSSRFIAEQAPRIVASARSASDPTMTGTTTIAKTGGDSFSSADIADVPMALPFVPHCAYVDNMVVARKATRRDSVSQFYRVDAATYGLRNALSDTGAGPSIVGSRVLAELYLEMRASPVSRLLTQLTRCS